VNRSNPIGQRFRQTYGLATSLDLSFPQQRDESDHGHTDPIQVSSLGASNELSSPSGSLRAICTVLLDPRDPLLQSERTQGFTADPVYGRAKCLPMLGSLKT
jgi:hypothetical protein